jgi:[ribosomal protein S18]-alanine N-acetyltransferase
VKIRPLTPEDCKSIAFLEAESPQASQWSADEYSGMMLRNLGHGWIAVDGAPAAEAENVVGFIFIRLVADEVEVLNLAVSCAHRRKGIASSLIREATQWARSSGGRSVWLEVRASNAGAIQFYERQGFHAAGRRPRYYSNPAEDAVLLNAAIS